MEKEQEGSQFEQIFMQNAILNPDSNQVSHNIYGHCFVVKLEISGFKVQEIFSESKIGDDTLYNVSLSFVNWLLFDQIWKQVNSQDNPGLNLDQFVQASFLLFEKMKQIQ